MTYTEATHKTLTLMAGPDHAWEGTGSRPTSDTRAGLFAFLADYANGICAFCGMYSDNGEICHVISAGPKRKGFVPANLVWGCMECNDIDGEAGGFSDVSFGSITRADLIPTVWPTTSELTKRGIEIKKARAEAKQIKKEIRGI